MELVINAPSDWENFTVNYTINDSAQQELVGSDNNYEVPAELYTAFTSNDTVAFIFTADNIANPISVGVTYDVGESSIININTIIDGELSTITVGEIESLKNNVVVSIDNLRTTWNALVSNVKNYTYSKLAVDNIINEIQYAISQMQNSLDSAVVHVRGDESIAGTKTFTSDIVGDITGNAATATKATNNASGNEITDTVINNLSVSGTTITYTQLDGTTGTITTQDTVYTHPTTAGDKHIPSGGSSGQFLGWDSDGTAKWVNNPNTDTLVNQNVSTTNGTYPVLIAATANATANLGAKAAYFGSGVKVNPSTSTISATTFSGALVGNVTGNCSGSSGSCTGLAAKATGNANGKELTNTIIKGLSISGKTITYTQIDGSTGTLTTQDTVYTHPTTAGNKHIPSGGSSDQILKYSASGTAVWSDTDFTRTLTRIDTRENPGEWTISTTKDRFILVAGTIKVTFRNGDGYLEVSLTGNVFCDFEKKALATYEIDGDNYAVGTAYTKYIFLFGLATGTSVTVDIYGYYVDTVVSLAAYQ